MKKIASFLIVASLASAAVAGQAPAPPQAQSGRAAGAPAFAAKKLTRADFDALRADPSRLLVIDVRRPDELTAIGGFPAYLSIQAAQLEKSLAWIPKDRTIVTVSNHAARAGRAADLLTKNGFNVAGAIGAQDYEAEGGTLVKIAPPAPRPASN